MRPSTPDRPHARRPLRCPGRGGEPPSWDVRRHRTISASSSLPSDPPPSLHDPASLRYSPDLLEGRCSRKLGLISHRTIAMFTTKLATGMLRACRHLSQ